MAGTPAAGDGPRGYLDEWRAAWRRSLAPGAKPQEKWPLLLVGLGLACVVTTVHLVWEGTAGNVRVEGVVMFEGRPVGDATVFVAGSRRCTTTTNGVGQFTLLGVPAGDRTIVIERDSRRAGFPLHLEGAAAIDVGELALYRWYPLPGGSHGLESPTKVYLYDPQKE